eukprot:TRINITY_DN6035_c0_g1_i4.p1 TRINITY_DN6035_c0_g1~~TRINITY_DN6035_c0_g1_i4.p1  ORF type:complete len:476 (-),score=125.99 TRINITY_DN6035_c0_g1_i4:94-1521(-)
MDTTHTPFATFNPLFSSREDLFPSPFTPLSNPLSPSTLFDIIASPPLLRHQQQDPYIVVDQQGTKQPLMPPKAYTLEDLELLLHESPSTTPGSLRSSSTTSTSPQSFPSSLSSSIGSPLVHHSTSSPRIHVNIIPSSDSPPPQIFVSDMSTTSAFTSPTPSSFIPPPSMPQHNFSQPTPSYSQMLLRQQIVSQLGVAALDDPAEAVLSYAGLSQYQHHHHSSMPHPFQQPLPQQPSSLSQEQAYQPPTAWIPFGQDTTMTDSSAATRMVRSASMPQIHGAASTPLSSADHMMMRSRKHSVTPSFDGSDSSSSSYNNTFEFQHQQDDADLPFKRVRQDLGVAPLSSHPRRGGGIGMLRSHSDTNVPGIVQEDQFMAPEAPHHHTTLSPFSVFPSPSSSSVAPSSIPSSLSPSSMHPSLSPMDMRAPHHQQQHLQQHLPHQQQGHSPHRRQRRRGSPAFNQSCYIIDQLTREMDPPK